MKSKQHFSAASSVILMLSFATYVHATKPCAPSPCTNAGGQFDRAMCNKSSAWIAQGTISNITHHREGHPTNKDFAEFTFTVHRWEKKSIGAKDEMRFTVGWCENQQELPARTDGLFRMFGLVQEVGRKTVPRYLYFESVPTEKKH